MQTSNKTLLLFAFAIIGVALVMFLRSSADGSDSGEDAQIAQPLPPVGAEVGGLSEPGHVQPGSNREPKAPLPLAGTEVVVRVHVVVAAGSGGVPELLIGATFLWKDRGQLVTHPVIASRVGDGEYAAVYRLPTQTLPEELGCTISVKGDRIVNATKHLNRNEFSPLSEMPSRFEASTEVALSFASIVSGRVMDVGGKPIVGARLVLINDSGPPSVEMVLASAESDTQGHYRIEAAAPNSTPLALMVVASDYLPARVGVRVSAQVGSVQPDIVLSAGSTLSGFIEGWNSEWTCILKVRATSLARPAVVFRYDRFGSIVLAEGGVKPQDSVGEVQSDGSFSIHGVVDDEYTLVCESPCCAIGQIAPQLVVRAPQQGIRIALGLVPCAVEVFDSELRREVPLAQLRLDGMHSDFACWLGTRGGKGVFVPPNAALKCSVFADGFSSRVVDLPVVPIGGVGTVRVLLDRELVGGKHSLRVTDWERRPVVDVLISMVRLDDSARSAAASFQSSSDVGVHSLPANPVGRYRVKVDATIPGKWLETDLVPASLELDIGSSPSVVEVVLDQGGFIKLEVTGVAGGVTSARVSVSELPSGRPVSVEWLVQSPSVSVWSESVPLGLSAQSLHPLPDGRYEVTVDVPDQRRESRAVRVTRGQVVDLSVALTKADSQ